MSRSDLTELDFTGIVEPLNGSGPRARATDRAQSHLAADRSQKTMHKTKLHVLRLVAFFEELPGSEINGIFRSRVPAEDWVAFDTPRKRAGELAEDGYLSARYETSAGNHLPEAWYSLTAKGRQAIA